jgi:hypothetical protein
MICPKCHKEIEYLICAIKGTMNYEFDGENYEEIDFGNTIEKATYICPECSAVITKKEEIARNLLKGVFC